jgi:WD40 repeat protein
MNDPKSLLARYQPRDAKPVTTDRQLAVVRYSPCGKILAAGDYLGGVQRWDAGGDKLVPLEPLTAHSGWVQALAFHSDGKTLFSADSWGRLCAWSFTEKSTKPIWDVAGAHAGWVRKLAVSPDGKALASCDNKGVLRLWSPDKGKLAAEFSHDHDLLCIAFAPDGKTLVAGDLFGRIHRRDVASGKVVATYDVKELYRLDRIQDVGGVRCLAFSPDGKTLAAAGCEPITGAFVQGNGLLAYIDSAGKRTQTLKIGNTNTGYVTDLAWHKDGFVMAVTSGQPGQGQLLFHRPGDAAPFFTTAKMQNCQSLAVHPDGQRLVVAATNANSSGNGRNLNAKKEYPGNSSPLHVWQMPKS